LIRNVVNSVSEEAFTEVYERALERIEKMSYLEFAKQTSLEDFRALTHIEDRIATAMAEDFIRTGEW
tara:strand:- start:98 stop:298 length:201 start_codon:yes stop_codon:yes gene_type:complete